MSDCRWSSLFLPHIAHVFGFTRPEYQVLRDRPRQHSHIRRYPDIKGSAGHKTVQAELPLGIRQDRRVQAVVIDHMDLRSSVTVVVDQSADQGRPGLEFQLTDSLFLPANFDPAGELLSFMKCDQQSSLVRPQRFDDKLGAVLAGSSCPENG